MFRVLEVKVAYIEQVRKIDERQELHTLECALPGSATFVRVLDHWPYDCARVYKHASETMIHVWGL